MSPEEQEARERVLFYLENDTGFWFGIVIADDPRPRARLREMVEGWCKDHAKPFVLHTPWPHGMTSLAIELAKGGSPGVHWIRADGPKGVVETWNTAATRMFMAMNERREAYRKRFKGGIIVEGRAALKRNLRELAPDLFSIRSFIAEPWKDPGFDEGKTPSWRPPAVSREGQKYLENVSTGEVDALIQNMTPEARRLLWVVTRAEEAAPEDMIAAVWGGPPTAVLGELCDAGLLVREGEDSYGFDDLVVERAAAWRVRHNEETGELTEDGVWKAYGAWYGRAFESLRAANKRDVASEMGRRGISYLVRTRAFEGLVGFASGVVTGAHDPALLGQVITDLQTATAEAPAGQVRWRLRTNLADALDGAGHPDQGLPLYALAAEEAEAAADWSDVSWICQNWANALSDVGQLDRARETYLRSAEASRRAGDPRVDILGTEMAALRVDVVQGRAEQVLPAIEKKLAEVRGFWDRKQRGELVPEAPDDEMLARTIISGLDVAAEANSALGRWRASLDLLGIMEEVKRARGSGEHELAMTRINRYGPLMRLGKLDEAKAVLEGCLEVYHRVGDVTREARALSALADVSDELGDSRQAIALARRALALHERLPRPEDRAMSHNNLAIYLRETGSPAEAKNHQLAALAYRLATGLDLRTSLRNLALRIRASAAGPEPFALPRLADLLALTAFTPLRTFLAERNVSIDKLQTDIDQLVEQARADVASPSPPAA